MEKDIPDDKLQALMLVQIYCSFNRSSSYLFNSFSLKELSVDVHKILGSYSDCRKENLEEFDGYSFEMTEEDGFKQKRKGINEKLKRLIREISNFVPTPIKDKSDEIEKPYEIDDNFKSRIENELVEKWYDKYGRGCYNFQFEDLQEVLNKVKEAGKFKIMDNARQHVIEETLSKDTYDFYGEFYNIFKNVPEACRHYADRLGDDLSIELLKERIRNETTIYDKEGNPHDWDTINIKINTWKNDEKKKSYSRYKKYF
jgi:hypothetical protein